MVDMTAQEFESLLNDFANHVDDVMSGDRSDVGAFRSFVARNPNVLELLREREHDVHMRVRLGYDKCVADAWLTRVSELVCALHDIETMMLSHGITDGQFRRDVYEIIDKAIGEPPHDSSIRRMVR